MLHMPIGWESASCCNTSSRSEPTSTYSSISGHLSFILPTTCLTFPKPPCIQAAPASLTPQTKLAAKPKRVLTRQEPQNIAWGKYHDQKEIPTRWNKCCTCIYVCCLDFLWAGEAAWSCESPDPSNGRPPQKKTMLNVPEFVRQQWQQNDQNTMAKMLMDCNFNKDRVLSFFQK